MSKTFYDKDNNVLGEFYTKSELDVLFESFVKVLVVSDITALTNEQIEALRCGDIVIKNESGNKHSYVVAYKKEDEMSLVYVDHENAEEVYYEKTGSNWAYIQTDNATL